MPSFNFNSLGLGTNQSFLRKNNDGKCFRSLIVENNVGAPYFQGRNEIAEMDSVLPKIQGYY